MTKNIRMCIASPPDRNELVVEFFQGNEQWAELNQENGILILEIYPKRTGEPWKLDFGQVQKVLMEGKKKLAGE